MKPKKLRGPAAKMMRGFMAQRFAQALAAQQASERRLADAIAMKRKRGAA